MVGLAIHVLRLCVFNSIISKLKLEIMLSSLCLMQLVDNGLHFISLETNLKVLLWYNIMNAMYDFHKLLFLNNFIRSVCNGIIYIYICGRQV